MIESTVLVTGGCFLTVGVDLVADHVVDPGELVDLVVDLKCPVDLYMVLRSVEAFLLFTISVLCAVFCVEHLDLCLCFSSDNLCLGSTCDHCNFFASKCLDDLCFSDNYVFKASVLWICGWLPCRLPCRSITHCPCRSVCRSAMCKPCRFACRSTCRFDHSASTV